MTGFWTFSVFALKLWLANFHYLSCWFCLFVRKFVFFVFELWKLVIYFLASALLGLSLWEEIARFRVIQWFYPFFLFYCCYFLRFCPWVYYLFQLVNLFIVCRLLLHRRFFRFLGLDCLSIFNYFSNNYYFPPSIIV